MNFPYTCPQCGVLVRDVDEAEMAESSCPDVPDACTLASKLDDHMEAPFEPQE